MANYKECLDGIIKASKGAMKEPDAFKALADIEETIQAAKANGYGVDKLFHGEDNAAVLMKMEKQHAYKKLAAIESKIKLAANTQSVMESAAQGNGIAKAVEIHGEKVKVNTEQRAGALQAKLWGHLEEEGVTDFFTQRMEGDKVARYVSELTHIDPVTKKPLIQVGGLDINKIPEADRMAYRTAKAMAKMKDYYHTMQNRLGAPVGFLEGHVAKNNFNAASIGLDKAVREEFLKETLEQADWSKIYTASLTPTQFMEMLTKKIASGIHGKLVDIDKLLEEAYSDITGAAGSRGSNLAEKLGKYRTIHIKPEYWNSYNAKWGNGDIYDSVLSDTVFKAREIELLQTYGANPELSFKTMLDNLKRSTADMGYAGEHPLDDRVIKEGLLKVILGTDQAPAHGQWARVMSSLRSHESATHLGNMLFTSMGDITIGPMYTASKLGHDTLGAQVQGWGNQFVTHMQALSGNLGSDQLKNALYQGHFAAFDRFSAMTKSGRPLQNVMVEEAVKVSDRGIMNQALNKFDAFNSFVMRKNPGKKWAEMGLQAQMNGLAYNLGDLARHSKLDPQVTKWFQELGILDYWDVLKTRVYTDTNSKQFIHIDALDDITDAEVRAIKGQDLSARQLANARDEILTNFKSSYMQHAQHALSMPGVGLQSRLALVPRGTLEGEMTRFIIQFKSFPFEFMTNTVYPIWKTQKGLLAAGMTANAAVFMLSRYLVDLASGKTPRDYWGTSEEEGAPLRNWVALATSVIGFPVLDEIIRRMLSEEGFQKKDIGTMLGPIFGDVGGVLENISKSLQGVGEGDMDKIGTAAIKTAKVAPIMGPILQGHVLKGALERMFLDNMHQMFNPNYMDSQEKIANLQGSHIIGR